MIGRRTFLTGASALALTPLLDRVANHHARGGEPRFLKPPKVERRFYLHPTEKGLRLVTDAVEFPLPIVMFDVFEAKMGEGSYRRHTQRDHWRLIEEGLFEKEDLITPSIAMAQFDVWRANYCPTSEAYGFLEERRLGPNRQDGTGAGVTFYEWGDDPAVTGLAVILDDLFAASLLQASFIDKGIPVEVLNKERSWTWPPPGPPEPFVERMGAPWERLGGGSAEFFQDRHTRIAAMRRAEKEGK